MAKDVVCVTAKGRPVKAKTLGQQKYLKAIEKNTITIGVGPAGTGKTYLAVAAGRRGLPRQRGQPHHPDAARRRGRGAARAFCRAICRTRSIPICGRCTTRCLICSARRPINKYLERGNIEVAPLAYMRGRTLDDSFIILDEAQNTTREQMKMFLTRLGFGSKIVITGDVTQIDLPGDKVSGLKEAIRVLDGVEDIADLQADGQRRRAPRAGAADRRRLR